MSGKTDIEPKKINRKEEKITCPACGQTATKTSWVVGRLLAWTIKCPNCKYTKDDHSFLKEGEQN